MNQDRPPSAPLDRLAALHRLLEADPRDTFCLYGIAQEHARRGDVVNACAFYDRVIEIEPTHAYAFFHKAKALEAAGRVDAALETLRLGLAAAKALKDPKAINELAGYLDELDG